MLRMGTRTGVITSLTSWDRIVKRDLSVVTRTMFPLCFIIPLLPIDTPSSIPTGVVVVLPITRATSAIVPILVPVLVLDLVRPSALELARINIHRLSQLLIEGATFEYLA